MLHRHYTKGASHSQWSLGLVLPLHLSNTFLKILLFLTGLFAAADPY